MKDTADQSPNIMLRLMSVISLMLAPVIMHFGGLI
jgi:Na+/H+-translocating membrane pyrophosphatase